MMGVRWVASQGRRRSALRTVRTALVLGVIATTVATLRPSPGPTGSSSGTMSQVPPASPVASPATAPGTASDPPAPGDVYLALGDSVAAGIGAGTPGEDGYPALLHGYLGRQAGHPVALVNLAVPGESSDSLVSGGQLDRALRAIADAQGVGRRVSPVTLTIGGNDILRAGSDPAAREGVIAGVATNVARTLEALRGALLPAPDGRQSDLVVTTYYDLTGGDPTLPGTDEWWVARLNTALAEQAAAAGALAVEVQAAFAGRQDELTWAPADIHPTDAGHRLLADLTWRALGYDREPPMVEILRPVAGVLPRQTPTVAARIGDRVGVVAAALWVDGQPIGRLTFVASTGEYVALWDTQALPPGPRAVEVRATDAAGNVGVGTLAVEVPPAAATSGHAAPYTTGA